MAARWHALGESRRRDAFRTKTSGAHVLARMCASGKKYRFGNRVAAPPAESPANGQEYASSIPSNASDKSYGPQWMAQPNGASNAREGAWLRATSKFPARLDMSKELLKLFSPVAVPGGCPVLMGLPAV